MKCLKCKADDSCITEITDGEPYWSCVECGYSFIAVRSEEEEWLEELVENGRSLFDTVPESRDNG